MNNRWRNKHFYLDENEVNGKLAMLNAPMIYHGEKGGLYYAMRHYRRDFYGNVIGYCYTIHRRRESK